MIEIPDGMTALPCPTCGGQPVLRPGLSGYDVFASCKDCYDLGAPVGWSMRHGRRGEEEAVLAWNDAVELFDSGHEEKE